MSGIFNKARRSTLLGASAIAAMFTRSSSAQVPAAAHSPATGGPQVPFLQRGQGAVPRTVEDKMRERVSVFDFMTPAEIADVQAGTAKLDVTAALQKARDYISANRIKLVFPPGVYRYSASPNWAIREAEIEFEGDVRLRYTGTGHAVIFDASAPDAVVYVSGFCYGTRFGWGTRPTIEASKTAGHGIFVRSMQRAKIGARVRGCGASSAGLSVEFAVCTEFDVVVSGNFDGWFNGAKPKFGYFLDRRKAGETTSYCTFVNPIVEGPEIGVQLNATLGNSFLGGTFEACGQYGVYAAASAAQDKFYGTDFEVNAVADVYDMGTSLVLQDCDTYTQLTCGSHSRHASIRGGRHSKISFDNGCVYANARDLMFNRFNNGAVFTDNGTNSTIDNVHSGGTDKTYLSGTLESAAFTVQNNTSIAKVVAVPGVKLGDFALAAYTSSLGSLMVWAAVTAPNAITVYAQNNSGAPILVPGGTWRATGLRR